MKIGLALGSGGARGLVHIGVLRSLEKHGIEITHVAGTSIGSLIGAMYCSGCSVDEIERRFLEDKMSVVTTFLDPGFLGGMLSGSRMKKLIGRWLKVDDFSDLILPFASVACDLKSGDEKVFQEGDLVASVAASMSVPGILKPVLLDGLKYVDGGIVNPVPDDVVREMGAEKVIAVNLDHRTGIGLEERKFRFALRVSLRALNIMRHHLAKNSINDADVVLNPEIADPGIIALRSYLDQEKSVGLIRLGERLMDDAIKRL